MSLHYQHDSISVANISANAQAEDLTASVVRRRKSPAGRDDDL